MFPPSALAPLSACQYFSFSAFPLGLLLSGIVPARSQVVSLPLGSFVGWNRMSGASLSRRVF